MTRQCWRLFFSFYERAVFSKAIFAVAENFVSMENRLEAQIFAGLVLDFFDLRPLDFLDAPALHAHQMVVMRPFVLDFVTRAPVGIVNAVDEFRLFQHFERAENGDAAHAEPFERRVDFVHVDVVVGLE